MAKLTAQQRKAMPQREYALPGKRFPVNDKTHAAVAKSYASKMERAGDLSRGQKAQIDRKADAVLSRGKMKGVRSTTKNAKY